MLKYQKSLNSSKGQSREFSILRRVRKLRKDATAAERLLWEELRNKKCLGIKFRRQHPIYLEICNGIKTYVITDFCCLSQKLIIEVDGDYHLEDDQWLHDGLRSKAVKKLGYCVARFTNDEIEHDLGRVMDEIRKYLKEK